MREIKFRGKKLDTDEWIYGDLAHDWNKDTHIIEFDCFGPDITACGDCGCNEANSFEVDPETVGQFTGLHDKNGKEIYEGDICRDSKDKIIQIVWSDHHQWGCKIIKGGVLSQGLEFPIWQWDKCKENEYRELEVIGNIYENPDLIGTHL